MSVAYARQGIVQEACQHLYDALDITTQTKVFLAFQRLSVARIELDQWKQNANVKMLDEHISNATVKMKGVKYG
jgi:hypothetical protein